jgi:hypothetical protein
MQYIYLEKHGCPEKQNTSEATKSLKWQLQVLAMCEPPASASSAAGIMGIGHTPDLV